MSFMTDERREALEAISRHPEMSLKQIGKVLKISEDAVKQRLRGMRLAYIDARKDCSIYEKYKVQLGDRGEALHL